MRADERRRSRARRSQLAAFAFAACALALAALACQRAKREYARPVESNSSRVDVFVRCSDPGTEVLGFSLAKVELVDESGAVRELGNVRRQVLATEAQNRVPLAGAIVPPARYAYLRLTIDSAWLERASGRQMLSLETATPDEDLPQAARSYDLALDLRLLQRDAASVFVEWNAAASSNGGLGFAPSFALSLERPQTSLGMLYVADAEIGRASCRERVS
jgi:hypothetical protein